MVGEAKANLECRLSQVVQIGTDGPMAASIVIGEVVTLRDTRRDAIERTMDRVLSRVSALGSDPAVAVAAVTDRAMLLEQGGTVRRGQGLGRRLVPDGGRFEILNGGRQLRSGS